MLLVLLVLLTAWACALAARFPSCGDLAWALARESLLQCLALNWASRTSGSDLSSPLLVFPLAVPYLWAESELQQAQPRVSSISPSPPALRAYFFV